jgi:hypothetical protein
MVVEVVHPENGLHNGLETRPSGQPAFGLRAAAQEKAVPLGRGCTKFIII